MNMQEFHYQLYIYEYLLRKDVRAAALIYPVNLDIIQELTYENNVVPRDIRWKSDPIDSSKIWLYKYDCVGLIIQEMYKMPHEAKEVMMGLLLGYSIDKEDSWLDYVREHKEDFNQHEFKENMYDMYFPENHPELYNDADEDEDDDYVSPEYEDYVREVEEDAFECAKKLPDCEI